MPGRMATPSTVSARAGSDLRTSMSAKIELFYINLDRATDRRAAIEKNILSSGFSDRWSFYRFSAVAAESELVQATPGRASRIRRNTCSSPMTTVPEVQP